MLLLMFKSPRAQGSNFSGSRCLTHTHQYQIVFIVTACARQWALLVPRVQYMLSGRKHAGTRP